MFGLHLKEIVDGSIIEFVHQAQSTLDHAIVKHFHAGMFKLKAGGQTLSFQISLNFTEVIYTARLRPPTPPPDAIFSFSNLKGSKAQTQLLAAKLLPAPPTIHRG